MGPLKLRCYDTFADAHVSAHHLYLGQFSTEFFYTSQDLSLIVPDIRELKKIGGHGVRFSEIDDFRYFARNLCQIGKKMP